jgi:hypothetical protein
MKNLQMLRNVLALIVVLMTSCMGGVTFTTPQPAGEKDLKEIPGRLLGRYVSEDKTNTIFVAPNLITRVYDLDITIHKKDIDSTMRLIGDTLITSDSDVFVFTRVGDSLKTHIHNVDTLYQTGSKYHLRKQKGLYYISKMIAENQWSVIQLSLSKGALTLGSISSLESIESATEIKENTQDTAVVNNYEVNPKQFKLIVRNRGFSDQTKYFRVKGNG